MATASTASADHLKTDHLVHNLGERARTGGAVTFSAQGIKFILTLTSAAILARLLNPADFGIVGMVLTVTGLLALFKDANLSTATIQREHVTQEQVSNLFWLNIVLGVAVCGASVAMAPLVAWFYHDARLTRVMWLLSLTFVITASAVQHQALLTRQMRFKALAVIDVVSMLGGVIMAACMALAGFEYWALVGQQLCVAAVTLMLTWTTSGWLPGPPRRGQQIRSMVSFGLHLTVADLIGVLTANTDTLLIGRFFGASPLGLYTRANVLLSRPLEQIVKPVTAVLVPVLSRLQSDPASYRRTFLKVYDAIMLITFPCAAVGFVLAQPVVLVVLGPKWVGAVPLFAGFALVAVTAPITFVAGWLFMSQGRGRDQLYTYLIAGPATVVAYLIGLHWGPIGVVMSLATANPLVLLPIAYYIAGRTGPVTAMDMWSGFFSFLPCWAAALGATALVRAAIPHAAPILQLAACAPLGVAAGLAAGLTIRRPRQILIDAWQQISIAGAVAPRGRKRSMESVREAGRNRARSSESSPELRKIALFGIFGVQNIGNEYTLQAMLYNVRQRAPEAGIYAVCYEPNNTEALHGIPALRVTSAPLSRKLPPARNIVIKLLRGVCRRVPLEIYDWVRAVKILRGTDLIVMTGTGMLTDYCSTSFGYPYDVFKWSLAARMAGCNVRFVGVGVGPIYSRLSRAFIKTALSLADYRGFRDSQSKNRMKQHGFERPADHVFPDLAFSLPSSIFPFTRVDLDKKPVVGLGVMKFVDRHKVESSYYDAAYDRYLDKMCDFAIWLLDRGYAVRVLEGDMRFDPSVRADLEVRLAKRGIVYGVHDINNPPIGSPAELLGHLSRVDFIVSPRFHNLVLGLMFEKPSIAISYDPKSDVLLESFGLKEYCQNIEDVHLETLTRQFTRLESEAARIREQLRRKSDECRSLLNEQYRQVLGGIEASPLVPAHAEPKGVGV